MIAHVFKGVTTYMCDRSHKMMRACIYVQSILSCFCVYTKEEIKTKTWVLARLKKGQGLMLVGFSCLIGLRMKL